MLARTQGSVGSCNEQRKSIYRGGHKASPTQNKNTAHDEKGGFLLIRFPKNGQTETIPDGSRLSFKTVRSPQFAFPFRSSPQTFVPGALMERQQCVSLYRGSIAGWRTTRWGRGAWGGAGRGEQSSAGRPVYSVYSVYWVYGRDRASQSPESRVDLAQPSAISPFSCVSPRAWPLQRAALLLQARLEACRLEFRC